MLGKNARIYVQTNVHRLLDVVYIYWKKAEYNSSKVKRLRKQRVYVFNEDTR